MGDDDKKADEGCCCDCCCCACCRSESNPIPEHLRDGNVFTDRSCTDCLMVIVYGVFVAGWVSILASAIALGKPSRIFKPTNFNDEVCGEGRLASQPNAFYPLPSRPNYAICVTGCPEVGTFVCNNVNEIKLGVAAGDNTRIDNSAYTHTQAQFAAGKSAATTCATACSSTVQKTADRWVGLQIKMRQKKCFAAFYPARPTLYRCIPSSTGYNGTSSSPDNAKMSAANESATTINNLKGLLTAGSFFTRGFAEIEQTYLVILVSAFTCMAMAAIWIFLLRYILAPLVYGCIILILGVLIALGFIFKFLADDLENNKLPGEKGTEDQVTIYRAFEYICFLAAAIYLVVMLFMLKRIKIALAVMQEATHAFAAAPSMLIIPVVTFFLMIGFVAFFIASTVYIQTMGSYDHFQFNPQADGYFGADQDSNVGTLVSTSSTLDSNGPVPLGSDRPTINMTKWNTQDITKALHAYNIFAILWTANFCVCLGFFIMAMCVCAWYFSATQKQMAIHDSDPDSEQGKQKEAPTGVVCTALCSTVCNHLGTVLWGSLLIAIMQFIRAVFLYLQENYLQDFKDTSTGYIVLKCVDCCLWYIEHVVRIISENAFIICVIRCSNFCSSAAEACSMIMKNAARISILSMLSAATLFLVKCFIVGGNIFIAYGLLQEQGLTDGRKVESGLFPMFIIIVMTFAIATLFLNVYDACIDTIFMCFLMDEEYFNGEFMPESLSKIVGMFEKAELARQEFEKSMKSAMNNAEAGNV